MERSDSNGNVVDEQAVHVGNLVKVSFEWDARGVDLAKGDSFTITLPQPFKAYEYQYSRALIAPGLDGGAKIGQCQTEASVLTCSFNAKAEELREAGYSDFSGRGTILLRAVGESSEPQAVFVAGGQEQAVLVPGGKVAAAPAQSHAAAQFESRSSSLTKASSTIGWSTTFGSDFVAEKVAESGGELVRDGKTRSSLVVRYTLSPGQSFSPDLSRWGLAMRTNPQSQQETTLTQGDGTDRDTQTYGDFDMDVHIDGSTATVTATGPFAPDTNYRIFFPTRVDSPSGTVKTGYTYAATSAIDGTGVQAKATRRYTESVDVTAGLKTEYGGFSVFALLNGNAASSVSEKVVFPVNVEYELPSGTTAASYPDWTAPGTLNAAKTGGTARLESSAGQAKSFDGNFPVGTRIKLSEDLPAAPEGVTWGKPVFTVGTKTVDSFVVRAGTVKVNLTNEATAPTKPSSSASALAGPSAAAKSAPANMVTEATATEGTAATTKSSASDLAQTGISIEAAAAVAVVLLMIGVYLAARRRGQA